MHPAALSDLDLLDEVNQFFGQMYGMDEDSVTGNILPALRGDLR